MNGKPLVRHAPAVLAFASAAALYWSASARSPGWGDATMILDSARALSLGVWANTHNLYNLLGHGWLLATPFLDPHRSLTLLCVLLGALTVLCLYLVALDVTRSTAAALFTAAAMAVSHSLWWHSATIEVYTLNSLLIALMMLFVFRYLRGGGLWRLCMAFTAAGLGVSNHILMALYVPAFALLLALLLGRRRIGIWEALLLVACGMAGGSLYVVLFVRQAVALGSVRLAIRHAGGGGFLTRMFPRGLPWSARLFWWLNYLFLLVWNFASAAIVLAVAGFRRLVRSSSDPTGAAFYLTGLAAQILWSANYTVWDMYAFALPVYIMLAVPLAYGLEAFLRRRRRAVVRLAVLLGLGAPLALYPTVSLWPGSGRLLAWYVRQYPESRLVCDLWEPAEYILNPVKCGYRGAELFATAWAARLPPDAHYWDDDSKVSYPLQYYYRRVRGLRPDVTLHAVFGPFMTEADAERHARVIEGELERGEPVFISALVQPEREILDQLYHLEAPGTPLPDIRSLGVEELTRTFPRTRVRPFPLGEGRSLVIYRLEREAAGEPGGALGGTTGEGGLPSWLGELTGELEELALLDARDLPEPTEAAWRGTPALVGWSERARGS